MGAITGGIGWAVLGAVALYTVATSVSLKSDDAEVQAIYAAIQNIQFHSKLLIKALEDKDKDRTKQYKNKIKSSIQSIARLLSLYYEGLSYNSKHNEVVNAGRVMVIESELEELIEVDENNNYNEATESDKKIEEEKRQRNYETLLSKTVNAVHNQDVVIGPLYRLPPYFSSQIVIKRLLVICVTNPLKFHDEYT